MVQPVMAPKSLSFLNDALTLWLAHLAHPNFMTNHNLNQSTEFLKTFMIVVVLDGG